MATDNREHWESVYLSKDAQHVSWFRPHLELSLQLLERAGLHANSRVIDIGGGASTLVDDLLDRNIARITVLDLSAEALHVAQQRLGDRARAIDWRVGDVTQAALPANTYDLWHDRAVLHFLVEAAETKAYARQAAATVRPGGHLIIGGFASDGPEKCSGLTVARREPSDIAALFDADFDVIDQAHEIHATPWGSPQHFAYALLRRRM